jgi:hypothetical protein
MNVVYFDSTPLLRYQTNGGFVFETSSEVVADYSSEAQTVTWVDTGVSIFYPRLEYSYTPPAVDFALSIGEQHLRALSVEQVLVTNPLALENCFLESPWYQLPQFVVVCNLSKALIQSVQRIFQPHTSKVINHALLAGKPFLVAQSIQEMINALVRDDTNYFQTIALAREHSLLNGLFSTVHNLRSFGREIWSKWEHYLHSSLNSCGWFAVYAIFADSCVNIGPA